MKALSKMISFTLVRDGEDGQNGKDGKPGPIIYPMGEWQSSTTYESTERARPYVEHFGEYYVLQSMKAPIGIPPSKDVAENGGHWMLMDKFNAVYTKILIAEFGKVGEAIFADEYMFSQYGVDEEGNPSKNYHEFPEYFTPNFMVNLKTGETFLNSSFIKGIVANNFVDLKNAKTLEDGYTLDIHKNSNIYSFGYTDSVNLILPDTSDYTGFKILIYNVGGTKVSNIGDGGWTASNHKIKVYTYNSNNAFLFGGIEQSGGPTNGIEKVLKNFVDIYPYEFVELTAIPKLINKEGSPFPTIDPKNIDWIVNYITKSPHIG